MKIKNHILRNALLAMAGFALIAQAAKAQTTTSYTDSGELLIGFRQASGSQDYLLKVGLASSLPSIGSVTFSLGTISTDIAALGGTGPIYWSVLGYDQNGNGGNGTLYASRSTSTPWSNLTGNVGLSSTAYSNITQITDGTYPDHLSTANSPVGLLESTAATNPFSYASYQPGGANSGGISLGIFTPSDESQTTQNLYLDVLPLDANQAVTGPSVPGYFSLSGNTITYTSLTPVPEPATVATGAFTVLVAATAIRRRMRKA